MKTLSPAELAKLEHAFATDPGSEAYKPLAEAYLGMGRFMEAMVVCKKGVKAHPAVADPRVLLARVYAEQGKDKKAIEELQGALQVAPADRIALRMLGGLQLKGGETAPGKENLLKAHQLDPADTETLEVMQKHGVAVPPPPAPAAPPPMLEPVVPAAGAVATSGVQQSSGLHPSMAAGAPRTTAPRPAARASSPQGSPRAAPASAPRAQQPVRRVDDYLDDDDDDERSDVRRRPQKTKKGGGLAKVAFFALVFLVPASAAGYYGFGQWRANRIKSANASNKEATALIKADTFRSYEQAIEKAQVALDLDAAAEPTAYARGLLAYAYTVRWGEHVHEESNRESAEKHITVGLANKEASSYLHAAEALYDFYQGKTADGLKAINARIATAEADKKQVSLYYLTRGVLQMNSGDLEASKGSLDLAQTIAPEDPRIYVALGTLHRRRGFDNQALAALKNALSYSRNLHPDALTGSASLILDQAEPGPLYCAAADYVKAVQKLADTPSPRQLAANNFVNALLISRVSRDLPLFTDKAFQKRLEECTGLKADEAQARKDIAAAENQGMSQDKNNPELLLTRGRRLFWEGKLDEAAAEIKKAIELNPQAAHFHVELARVLSRKEGGEAATEESLKRALTLVPASPKLFSMLGQAQYKQKKYDEALATFQRAVSDDAIKNPEARFFLGKLFRDQKKDAKTAVTHFQRAGLEYFADPSMASLTFDELAQTYEGLGDGVKASESYEKALNADRSNPGPYCHYARLLANAKDQKDRDKAKSLAGEFVKLGAKDACTDEMQKLSGT